MSPVEFAQAHGDRTDLWSHPAAGTKHVVASGRAGKWAGGRVRYLRLLIGLDGRLITVLERAKPRN